MAELAGIVITSAALAYDSSKKLLDLINQFRDASKTLNDLYTDLGAIQRLLQSLRNTLKATDDVILSDGIRNCLLDLKPFMEACSKACDEFVVKLENIMSNSTEDHVRCRDKVRLLFEEKVHREFAVSPWQPQVADKHCVGIDSDISNRSKSSEQKGEAMEDLSNNIAVVMNRISGQMEGLEISLQSLSDTDLDAHRGVIETLQGQDIILWQCLKVCTSAVDAAPLSTGYMVRRMEGFGSAKQLVTDTFGNAGPDPQGSYPLPWAMF